MDIGKTLAKFKDLVAKEKQQLDGILRGAELLADMLIAEQTSGNQATEKQHSEPGLETERSPGEGQ